jgi:hypothetical protein
MGDLRARSSKKSYNSFFPTKGPLSAGINPGDYSDGSKLNSQFVNICQKTHIMSGPLLRDKVPIFPNWKSNLVIILTGKADK